MFKRIFYILIFLHAVFAVNAQTTVTGVINLYYEVVGIASNAVTLTSVTGLNAGDTVMLYQSKGASINTTNSSSFGNIVSMNEAGNWELLIVQSVNTTSKLVTFTCNTSKYYSPPLQLIRVPSYNDAVVSSILSCQLYNGITGGVLCMIVRNNLTLNAPIDVSNRGFNGAMPDYSLLSNCAYGYPSYQRYSYTALSDSAGFKGDGIFGDPMGLFACGRGKKANGGGGGNGLNSSGAGGGNGGAGGRGGGESNWCMYPVDCGGLGGLSLQPYYSNGQIFMGGGGGAGTTEIVASDPTAGGNGGGIAIIIAGNITGNGQTISSKGADVTGTTYEESAGGGGAGGSVVIYASSITGALNVNVSGGKGGNSGSGSNATCRGSGGGGAGGMIIYNSGAAGITKIMNAGMPGSVPPTTCSAWQGLAGEAGSSQTISSLPLTCISIVNNTIINTIQANQHICYGAVPAALTGNAATGGSGSVTGYLWERSTDGGFSWFPCPPVNNGQNYTFGAGLTQTTMFRRQVTFSSSETSYSNIVTIYVFNDASAVDSGPYCVGETISLFAGPSGMIGYSWAGPNSFANNNQNPIIPSATTAMSGTYTVTVTNGNGCTSTSAVVVTVNPLHTATASSTGPYCAGQTIQLNLTTSGTTYEWSGPGGWTSTLQYPTRPGATTTMTGTYYVTVSGAGACPVFTSTQVTVNPTPNATATNTGPYCPGQTITLNAGPSSLPQYSWSGPGGFTANTQNTTRPSATTAMSGPYTVTETNGFNCSATATTGVTVNPNPTVFIVQGGGNICPGNAGIPVSLSGSQNGVVYHLLLNGNPAGVNVTGSGSAISFGNQNQPGTYTVMAENTTTGCSQQQQGQAFITVSSLIIPWLTHNPISCHGFADGSITANATDGNPPYTWLWSTGSTAQTITNLGPDNYSVTVTDQNGCAVASSMNLTNPPILFTWAEQAVQPLCYGDTTGLAEIGVSGGTPPYNYLWNTGAVTAIIGNLPPDTFYCTVTDSHGCIAIDTVWLQEPVAIQAFIDGSLSQQHSCYGASDGVIVAGANGGTGAGTFSFVWDNGITDSVQTGLSQNYYYVTATDANGCTGTATGLLAWPHQIIITADTIVSPQSYNDGYIEITVDSAVAPVSFVWSNGAVTQNIYFLITGTYTVTVTDGNSCTAVASFTLVPANLNLIIEGDSILCEGSSGLLHPASSFPVIAGVSYLWNTGDTTATISISPAASQYFYLTVTDPVSIQYTDSIWVEVLPYPVFHITGDSVICQGNPAVLQPSVSSSNYVYLWSEGNTTPEVTVFPPTTQTYWLVITDRGCAYADSIEVLVSPSFHVQITGDTSLCKYDTTTFRAVTDNSAITSYSYLWSPYSSTDSLPYWALLQTGTIPISVTVTAGACVVTETIDLLVKPRPEFQISGNTQICSSEFTTLTCDPPQYNYVWSITPPFPAHYGYQFAVSPSANTTYYAYTTSNGCDWADTITVTVNTPPQMTLSYGDSICPGQEAKVIATITGSPPYAFNVTNGIDSWPFSGINTSPYNIYFTPTQPGTHNITGLTDGNGCAGNVTQAFNITFDPSPSVFAGNDTAVCSNTCPLYATLMGNETGLWTSLQPLVAFVQPDKPNTTVGVAVTNQTYTFIWTVTNSDGCSGSDTVNVMFNDNPPPPFAGDDQQIMHSNKTNLNATMPAFGLGHWNLIDGFGVIADTLNAQTLVTDLLLGDNIFRWTVENPPCPSKFDEVTISVLAVTIPTGFSPNNDGKNDNFVVTGIEMYPENSLEVFNRWGILVYSSVPYNNNWNGKDNNDKHLPDDTYFYVLHLNNKEFLKGYVVIHR
jgi:gliding motility-associated-like protein